MTKKFNESIEKLLGPKTEADDKMKEEKLKAAKEASKKKKDEVKKEEEVKEEEPEFKKEKLSKLVGNNQIESNNFHSQRSWFCS
jgi:hypothetical protein